MKAGVCRYCWRPKDVDPGLYNSYSHHELPDWCDDLCLQCFAIFCRKVSRAGDELSEDLLNLFLAKRLLELGKRLRRGQTIDRCQSGDEQDGQCEQFAEVTIPNGIRVCKKHHDWHWEFPVPKDWSKPDRSKVRDAFVLRGIVYKAKHSIEFPHDNREFSVDLGRRGQYETRGIATLYARAAYVRHRRKRVGIKGEICRLPLPMEFTWTSEDFVSPKQTPFQIDWRSIIERKASFVSDYGCFTSHLPTMAIYDLDSEHNQAFTSWPKWMWRTMKAGNDQYLVPIDTRLALYKLRKRRRAQAMTMWRVAHEKNQDRP